MVLSRSLLALALLVPLLAACTGQELFPVETPVAKTDRLEFLPAITTRAAPWSNDIPPYRLGYGDKIRVMFTHTPEMDQDVLVRPDGVITLKSAGEVAVTDLTPSAASALIARKSMVMLRDPVVSIEVLDPVSARIYIGGEVHGPGAYRITGPLDVVAAMQFAGGAAETARLGQVVLIRRSADGRPMLKTIDLRGLIEGKPVDDPQIVPGDILFVPRSRIAEVDLWVDQFITKVVPFQRSFSYSVGTTSSSAPIISGAAATTGTSITPAIPPGQ